MNAEDGDRLRVFLRDCRVDLRVGVYPHEKEKPQPVLINVEMEMILSRHYNKLQEDDLSCTINYDLAYQFIHKQLALLGHIPLLETVAEQIIAFCFRDIRIQKVRVRLEKPNILPDAAGAGIEIERTRQS